MRKRALVTGATSGIGEATAIKLADLGYNLIITGRRRERLTTLQKKLELKGVSITTLAFDIRKKQEVEDAWNQLSAEELKIDILVNNAGLASGLDPIHNGKLDDWEAMIDTNLKGLLYISRLVSPGMVERRSGHIINVSSIAGVEVYANGNVYCASKHAVQALTKGMRIDLLPYSIKVSSISPGMVDTEFSTVRFHGDKKKADDVYKDLTPLYANDVAEAIEFIITRPPHVNVNDMLLMPTNQASATCTHRKNK
ncbi:SDR family NAD(P)-dependent oxidoreductase [Natronoflexus pectinivorans]|uniref:NADP-dependent 3-hydroxy acid dehydrogenase YdfG n=1 Tax=Natronoflexus pectinivorans TaxID=682526 RepID=A0A4R2GPN7_9BACT|nr:SDR family NAD(P)-dependent oxidoreductase [Natronoflexus pectinivorans]TCO09776.1 hypothetical protein EV194_102202 [Natronoflexus pectinivorans]